MRVGVLGISFKSSELSLRERIAKTCQMLFGSEEKEAARLQIVLLSTCNRTEIYFSGEDLTEIHSELLSLLRQGGEEPFEHKLYSYFGVDCFAHLALVTSGLDSVILAETEIQRQVKTAYENACLYYALPSCMHFMFQKCLKIGKSIRTSFPQVIHQVHLEGILFQICKSVFSQIKQTSVLFVGNSEINRKILSFFKAKGISEITLCTRAKHSVQEEFKREGVEVVDWSHLPYWHRHDIVISGTNSSHYLIHPLQIAREPAVNNRLLFDLSIPRTMDPCLARHPQLTLMNVEEIGRLIQKRQNRRLLELSSMSDGIRAAAEKQMALFQTREKKAIACTA